MAQAFVPTGSSLVSTTAVGAFLEVAYRQQAAEKALATPQNLVGVVIDDDAGTARITATLPGVVGIDATTGKPTFTATNYSSTAFTVGTGELKSTNMSAAFLEMAQKIVAYENVKFASTPSLVKTFLLIDSNAGQARISSTLPVTSALVGGLPTITAVDYL
jgi:hypothetical protein